MEMPTHFGLGWSQQQRYNIFRVQGPCHPYLNGGKAGAMMALTA
jgi:hypothetical protein